MIWVVRFSAAAYVLAVAATATIGFGTGSTAAILLAGALTLPTGVPAIIGFYLVYGLLALVPGANPDESSGWSSCSPDRQCTGSSTGGLAPWFVLTTDLVGILALTGAALLNVAILVRFVRSRRGSPAPR